MTDLKEIILADAIESAVKAEKENIKLKRVICVLFGVIVALCVLMWCR